MKKVSLLCWHELGPLVPCERVILILLKHISNLDENASIHTAQGLTDEHGITGNHNAITFIGHVCLHIQGI